MEQHLVTSLKFCPCFKSGFHRKIDLTLEKLYFLSQRRIIDTHTLGLLQEIDEKRSVGNREQHIVS
jgi:hypothetical protein